MNRAQLRALGELGRASAAVGVQHEAVEVMQAVLGEARAAGVTHEATLSECRCAHASLNAFDQRNLLGT